MVCTIGTKPQRRLGDVPKGVTVNTTIEGPDGISLHVVHTDEPNDRFEEWCSRKNKVRSLHQPATQRRRHASASCSQGPFLHHSSADWGFQRMFSH